MAIVLSTAIPFALVPIAQWSGALETRAFRTTEPVLSGSKPTRRAALLTAGGLVAATTVSPQPAFAADEGAWAKHKGPFDDAFFSDFRQAKASPDFLFKFVEDGEGDSPVNFQSVSMHYSGYLLDGTKFDSSYDRGTPFKFRVGKGKVISAWEGLALVMRPGSKLIAKVPAQFAYGDKSVGPIPAGSTLVFYMELVSLGNIRGDKPRLPDLSEAGRAENKES